MPSAHEEPPESSTAVSVDSINVITYNVFGLKYIAKYRRERLQEIGRLLSVANPPPEIVGLQECWTQEDYLFIRDQTKGILPYAKYYFSGIFGGGLAILSKWPIEESTMYRYPLNGRPSAFWRGDWYVGKGVACARIRVGPASREIVDVFCTHLHAPYESEPRDSYICHRTAQAWEISKLMRAAAEKGHLVLGLGDFNMLPLSLAHQLIESHGSVKDVWRILHPESSLGPSNYPEERSRGKDIPTAVFNLIENGAASDGVFNTWRWPSSQQKQLSRGREILVDDDTPDPKAKRLDYIFLGGDESCPESFSRGWEVQDVKVGMTQRHPTLGCSLSDHFSIEAQLKRHGAGDSAYSSPPKHSRLGQPVYEMILKMIETYRHREQRQRFARLVHFGVALVFWLACLISIWWSPFHYVSFLILLASTLSIFAGTLDGLIGGLFVGSELRALTEFEWEIRQARKGSGKEKD